MTSRVLDLVISSDKNWGPFMNMQVRIEVEQSTILPNYIALVAVSTLHYEASDRMERYMTFWY